MPRSLLTRKPNLLLCFDAFGTLFSPMAPVAQQYADIARQCGITIFNDRELQSRLFTAIKDERVKNPNFGKATGLGATGWWTNVIQKTFKPILQSDQPLPPTLVPRLMHRFSSSEGYVAESNLVSTLRTIRRHQARHNFDRVVIGVVTNSDDRVPSILSSFGLRVSPLRYGSHEPVISSKEEYDIDFHCMSYDVGYEKPDRRIFAAAEDMLSRVVTEDGETMSTVESDSWQKVYVGDEYAKDVVGAADAGWNPVLLDVEGSSDVCNLEDCVHEGLEDVFAKHAVVRVRSLHGLAVWLTGGRDE